MSKPENELKRTPLFEVEKEQGARFAAFHGWEMAASFADPE
jgi:glycine cleavage system aminomethyltransferase T